VNAWRGRCRRLLVGWALLIGAAPAWPCLSPSDAVIAEIGADNVSTVADEDGDYSDWIEIYNPCQPLLDLGGWYVTDDPDVPAKWQFPPGVTLGRGGQLLVFASGKNRASAGSPLHTNFKLDRAGEYLALVEPDGVTIAHAFTPLYPPQFPGFSYGIPQAQQTLIAAEQQVSYHVPGAGDAALGSAWAAADFDASSWETGATGIGMFGATSGGLDVVYYKANITVSDLATAEAVIEDPATHVDVVSALSPVVNFLNTGGAAHFSGDAPFPGTTIGSDVNDFVVLVSGYLFIPQAGAWTFGVNSDDGFALDLQKEPYAFHSSYPSPRGPGDTLAVFQLPEAGIYKLRLVFYERGGGSELELFAAQGSYGSFSSSAFRLVGDVANGGLATAALGSKVRTDVAPAMRGVNASLWVRATFQVPDPSAVGLLLLDMAYEDGFVAYLNGQEVARRNAPAALEWNSEAASDRPIASALSSERIDLTDFTGLLQAGTNVLALHGLNDDPADPDFLLLPELKTMADLGGLPSPVYFTVPTPASPNGAGFPGVSAAPVFSHPSGTFQDPFTLSISSSAPGAPIRYTLDGSEPSATHGTLYTGPISIQTSNHIRARVLQDGLAPGPVLSRMYARLGSDLLGFTSNLPIVIVDSFGSAIAEDWWTPTLASFLEVNPLTGRASASGAPQYVGRGGIRIRGSSSRGFPKKQYFLETWDETGADLEVSLLGLPGESDWILYAPYSEKSLMQNNLAYEWSNRIGRYAVRTRLCEVYLRTGTGDVTSADYVGVYALMEKIKQDPNRVNIQELLPDHNALPELSGGYILKYDRLDPGDVGFATSQGFRFAYVDPKEEEVTPQQAAYIKGYLDAFEAALHGPNAADPLLGYAAYIDVGSFIDHHILVEMTKNIDGFRLSTFYTKDRNGKIVAGPIWDYNLSLGNANYLEAWIPSGWYHTLLSASQYPWWPQLFADPEFQLRYADRWFELRRGPFSNARILADIDGTAALLEEAQQRNFQRWLILGVYVWPNYYVGPTYASEVAWMRQFLLDRLGWIDSQFPTPPAFDPAPGAVLSGATVALSAASGTIYYTLDGSDPRLPGGAVSPSALVYGAPIPVTATTRIRARALSGTLWSAQNDGTYEPLPPARVNEVLPLNATVIEDEAGDLDPWIELYNPHVQRLDWSGMFLSDDPALPTKWPFPPGTSVCGLDRLLVWADGESAEGPLHASFTLNPGGGWIGLYDTNGMRVDGFSYPALGANVSYGRMPDGAPNLVSFLYPTPEAANTGSATVLLVNEYNAVSPNRFLGSNASDVFWGRILGNGGDWIELVVVADHLDIRGWQVEVRDAVGLPGESAQTLTLSSDPLLADLRGGTILTVGEELPTNASYAPASGDWWIHLRAGPSGDGQYVSALDFSVSNEQTQITIRDASGNLVFGPVGEGVHPTSGVGSDEVFKLEENPAAGVTAFSAYKDGTSSSFGAPNLWSGGTAVQDFSALRAAVSGICTSSAECVDGNPCTDDVCADGSCANAPNTAPCDDADPCTSNDTCAERVCRGLPIANCCDTDCDCDDGGACTVDRCVAERCSHVPTGTCGIGGTLRYYRAAGNEPSATPVPGVGIDANADGLAEATTGADGQYALPGLAGTVTLTTLGLYGTPRAANHNDAISSFDAALIAQAVVALTSLSPQQRIAADVTGNGEVTAFDAAHVAQFSVMLRDHFDVATATGSDWRFLRCDSYVDPFDQDCGTPRFEHAPLQGPATDDFYAVLYGDVSGNWAPAPASGALGAGAAGEEARAVLRDRAQVSRLRTGVLGSAAAYRTDRPARLVLDGVAGPLRTGERRTLEVGIRNATGVEALDLELDYDPTRLAIVDVERAGLLSPWSLAFRDSAGTLRLAAYGPTPLAGEGPILTITVEGRLEHRQGVRLRIAGKANEGRVALVGCEVHGSAR